MRTKRTKEFGCGDFLHGDRKHSAVHSKRRFDHKGCRGSRPDQGFAGFDLGCSHFHRNTQFCCISQQFARLFLSGRFRSRRLFEIRLQWECPLISEKFLLKLDANARNEFLPSFYLHHFGDRLPFLGSKSQRIPPLQLPIPDAEFDISVPFLDLHVSQAGQQSAILNGIFDRSSLCLPSSSS